MEKKCCHERTVELLGFPLLGIPESAEADRGGLTERSEEEDLRNHTVLKINFNSFINMEWEGRGISQETDLQGMVMSQLRMIEHTYDAQITNKEEICIWIISATHNPREILTIALALNNWVAVNNPGRIFSISQNIVQKIVAGTVGRW